MRKLKVTELNRLTTDEYRASVKTPLTVVLDNVRSMNNVGSVFRTADAFRLEAVYLCGITAVPPDPEIHKTALGAEDTVSWRYFKNTLEAISELKQRGYIVCALEQAEGSVPLENFHPERLKKYALIIGHEVKGVQQEAVNECSCCIEIRQYGVKHSLNVAVSAGIAIYDITNKLLYGKVD